MELHYLCGSLAVGTGIEAAHHLDAEFTGKIFAILARCTILTGDAVLAGRARITVVTL
ncbi:hypothetical protein GCM10027098_42240 [Bowmanella dokdonensis]